MKWFIPVRLAYPILFSALISGCGGGDSSAPATPLPQTPPPPQISASRVIDSTGGTLSVTDASSPLAGTTIVVPAGALASPTTITINQVTSGSGLPADVVVVDLGPTGTVFSVPVTVTVPYSQQYLTNNNISDPTTLKVVVMNVGAANETRPTVTQDTVNRTITAQTTHFSSFAVLGYSNASLSGTYAVTDFYVESSSSNPTSIVPLSVPSTPFSTNLSVPIGKGGHSVDVGTVTFDGAGAFTLSVTKNKDGVVTAVTQSGTYSVAADGVLTIGAAGLTGQVMTGGSAFNLGSASGDPEIVIGIKKSGAFSNASLSGAYAVTDFYVESSSSNPTSIVPLSVPSTPFSTNLVVPIGKGGHSVDVGTVNFDGAGGFTLAGTKNKDGVVTTFSQSGSYSVAADGVLTIGAAGLTGQVMTGGSAFTLGSASGDPEIAIGILK